MAFKMTIRPSVFFMSCIMLSLANQAFAMTCETPLGIALNCPTVFNDNDKAFCCNSQNNIPYCCDIGEFIGNNTAIIAGVAVAGLIVLLIITLCCCCFCSCCLLAKRRTHQGTVYGPVSHATAQPASTGYPLQPPAAHVVHPPPSNVAPPPGVNAYYSPQGNVAYYAAPPSTNAYPSPPYSNSNNQPPMNPHYPHN